jgi:hypothetical protein
MDAQVLAIPCRLEPQMHLLTRRAKVDREEEATVEFVAIDGERIHLFRRVATMNLTLRGASASSAAHNDDVPRSSRRLALDTNELRA